MIWAEAKKASNEALYEDLRTIGVLRYFQRPLTGCSEENCDVPCCLLANKEATIKTVGDAAEAAFGYVLEFLD